MSNAATTPTYAREDLDRLKAFSADALYQALRSFNASGLSDDAMALRVAELLDAERVPGLAQAQTAADGGAVREAVWSAARRHARPPTELHLNDAARRLADDALENRFTFYGETHQLAAPIDFDGNPGTAHWGHDLNRFTYLEPLTNAFLATGDRRYGRTAVELILRWIEQADMTQAFAGTPYIFGSYLNNAIHCRQWAVSLSHLLSADDAPLTPQELLVVLKSLHDQLAYLEIVTNGHAGNWPTIGCMGIVATLADLPLLRDSDRFVDYCVDTLAEQINQQVLPDGVQDELTPHYHQVVLNNLVAATDALHRLGRQLHPRTVDAMGKMVHYAQQVLTPDGQWRVAFNDSDPEAVHHLPAQLAGIGMNHLLRPPRELGPALFPWAGVAFLRQPATEGDLYLAFDGGPFGRSHQHEDQLGFWLHAYGRSFLVDPGRHLYDGSSKSFRAYLQSTQAHSTICIDRQGQHNRGRRDTWIPRQPAPVSWRMADDEVRAGAAYTLGYGPENEIRVVHQREIVFGAERYWVVFDRVVGEGEHRIDSRFQFAPNPQAGDRPLTLDGDRITTRYDDANLLLTSLASSPWQAVSVAVGQDNPRLGWFSSVYGRIEPAPTLTFSGAALLPFTSATLLYPYRGTTPPNVSLTWVGRSAVTVADDQVGQRTVEIEMPAPDETPRNPSG